MSNDTESIRLLKRYMLKEKGLPEDLESHVNGNDVDSISADIDSISKYIKPNKPIAPLGGMEASYDVQVTNNNKTELDERSLRELAQSIAENELDC